MRGHRCRRTMTSRSGAPTMRVLWLLVTAGGVLAFSAVPSHEPGLKLLLRLADWRALLATPSAAPVAAPLEAAARWSECQTLFLGAGGFFTAPVSIRRR